MRDTGLQFLGLVMGDHSKAGIQSMFNTGTIVGVASNVFGEGFPPKFVPSFSWVDLRALSPIGPILGTCYRTERNGKKGY